MGGTKRLLDQGKGLKNMILAIASLTVGLALLVWSADRFVEGSAAAAGHFGMPPLLIGMVIVGFGTSAPEMLVSALASYGGNPGIALGNVIGSNLFNTLGVVGIAGAIHPMTVDAQIFHRDLPVMSALTVSLFLLGYGFRGPGRINRLEGAVLVLCYIAYSACLVFTAGSGG
jgi:cation:H+ antiporter